MDPFKNFKISYLEFFRKYDYGTLYPDVDAIAIMVLTLGIEQFNVLE